MFNSEIIVGFHLRFKDIKSQAVGVTYWLSHRKELVGPIYYHFFYFLLERISCARQKRAEIFFVNFDFKNGCKNEFQDNNEKSGSCFKNWVPQKIDFRAVGTRESYPTAWELK